MFSRCATLVVLLLVETPFIRGQEALPPQGTQLLKPSQSAATAPESAWLDLRQNNPAHSKVQDAPAWVESISFTPAKANSESAAKSVFLIRLSRPNDDCQLLLFRLYFDDLPNEQPELVAWDESGSQVLRSGSLGQKTGLATSSTTIVPMIGVTAIGSVPPPSAAIVGRRSGNRPKTMIRATAARKM